MSPTALRDALRRSVRSTLGLTALLLAGCASEKMALDSTILVQSPYGSELGVSTDYGVVFLGNRSRAGEVNISSWFGDGANVEASVIEPIGHGLYTAEVDIVLPWVRITFAPPRVGERVQVVGRHGSELWEEDLKIATHPSVEGLLLQLDRELANDPTQAGAGVFVEGENGYPLLLGLVSGRLELTVDGETKQYLTVLGPDDLWRLVVHRREAPFRKRWIYRDDVL